MLGRGLDFREESLGWVVLETNQVMKFLTL